MNNVINRRFDIVLVDIIDIMMMIYYSKKNIVHRKKIKERI